jgi:hypothetical protein
MRIECNVIKDLLPLYVDDCCSAESKQLVMEHLKKCEKCKNSYEHMKSPIIDENIVINCESEKNDEIIMKRGIKKIRRIWIMSLVIVVLIVPVSLMTFNEGKGEGRCFTNIDEIYNCKMFLNAIENGNFEKAFDYIDNNNVTNSDPIENDINHYRETAKDYFIKDMQLLSTNGFKITDSKFASAYRYDLGWWAVEYNIYMENENGRKEYIGRLGFTTTANGIDPSTCVPTMDSNLNESPEITYLMEATRDWKYETFDDIYDDNQFERVKENETWR